MSTSTVPNLVTSLASEHLGPRQAALAAARETYTYMHSYTYGSGSSQQTLEPIAVLGVDEQHPFPKVEGLNPVQIIELGTAAAKLAGNVIVKLTNLIGVGRVPDYGSGKVSLAEAAPVPTSRLSELVSDLKADVRKLHECAHEAMSLASDAEHGAAALVESTAVVALGGKLQLSIKGVLDKILRFLLEEAAKAAGLYGQASSMEDYRSLFQTFPVPDAAATVGDDQAFARMRVAGPNPLVIQRVESLASTFPVEEARFRAVMGEADSLAKAGSEGRLYLADYSALAVMKPGSFPSEKKYVEASLALFAVPMAGSPDRGLRPVAIQCGQENSSNTPVLYPDDGTLWELAKIHVQAADGNHHELISHLGLTHLVIEPFAVSTHRQLPPQHPLFVLLIPHFQGTLFINNSAITSLISPGGTVDRLLAGTIESDWLVSTNAIGAFDFDQAQLPKSLAARGVDDPSKLPDYPYRDDALPVWNAIRSWVSDYLGIYYSGDAAVAGDAELQAWHAELVAQDGGNIGGFGETGPDGAPGIFTLEYLVDAITMVIFTASAQHAAVNFPQLSTMSYAPALPLAAYGPPPIKTSIPPAVGAEIKQLPPLQQAVVQQILGQGLGGVYFGRLGQYGRHQRGSYFSDARVQAPLASFQAELEAVEKAIGQRNLTRARYEVLMPSRIPQSINI